MIFIFGGGVNNYFVVYWVGGFFFRFNKCVVRFNVVFEFIFFVML